MHALQGRVISQPDMADLVMLAYSMATSVSQLPVLQGQCLLTIVSPSHVLQGSVIS